jgi:hypothetical protein
MAGTARTPELGVLRTYTTSSSADEMDAITAPAQARSFSVYFVTTAGKYARGDGGVVAIGTGESFATHYGPVPADQWVEDSCGPGQSIGLGSGGTSVTYHICFYGEAL